MLLTSESVAAGHPDKVCDQISDAVLDYCLAQNPNARVACETLVSTNEIIIRGEVSGAITDPKEIARVAKDVIKNIGYTQSDFNPDDAEISVKIKAQSADIAMGVDSKDQGAGDQGIMFGFATNQTPAGLTPQHLIAQRLMGLHQSPDKHDFWGVKPDAKCQFTVDTKTNVNTLVISISHQEGADVPKYVNYLVDELLRTNPELAPYFNAVQYYVNPTGRFVECGPSADVGLTGRKIVVDSYGGICQVGGGAFSGKDPSKVDRSAAYMARYLAKMVVRNYASLPEHTALVSLAYAIGIAQPVAAMVQTNFLSSQAEETINAGFLKSFDLTPAGIINFLKLKEVRYTRTAENGHFGHQMISTPSELCFTWE